MSYKHLRTAQRQRTYYLHRDGSVSKAPTSSHLLRIRAESMEEASLIVLALETKLRRQGIYLPFEEVSRG